MLDHFWGSKAGYLKSAALLIRAARMFKKEALQLIPNSDILWGAKAKGLVAAHLRAQANAKGP